MMHGSLFSGIGGFDLAAEWAGWQNVFHCERDPFCQKVLSHHFPNSNLHDDVTTFESTQYRGRIDVLSGGFPCQPFSTAGKRKGTDDERHLWPSMLRIIREIQPRYVVGENVRGLLNWNEGMVFEQVCADLETSGYDVAPFLLPSCGVNAPHRRDRIFFVAYSARDGGDRTPRKSIEAIERPEGDHVEQLGKRGKVRDASEPDSTSIKVERINRQRKRESFGRDSKSISNRWEDFPTVTPICGGNDGIPKELDGITFPKWRTESIKAFGNAIVPQVAFQIFEAINECERNQKTN